MKRVTIDCPERTLCMFVCYVYVGENGGMLMGASSISTVPAPLGQYRGGESPYPAKFRQEGRKIRRARREREYQ